MHPEQSRKKINKQQQAALEKSKQKSRERRRLGIVGGVIFAAAASISGAVIIANRSNPDSDTPQPITDQKNAFDLISNQMQILDASPSPKETEILERHSFDKLNIAIEDEQSYRAEAEFRIYETLEFMRESQNPIFQEAINFMDQTTEDNVRFNLSPTLVRPETLMAATPVIDDGRLRYYIEISTDNILYGSNTLSAALALTHELKHAQNGLERQRNFPPETSADTLMQQEQDILHNPDLLALEEASGYGIQSQALIWEYDFGFNGTISAGFVIDAATFTQFGYDAKSPEWIEYIKKTYVSNQIPN